MAARCRSKQKWCTTTGWAVTRAVSGAQFQTLTGGYFLVSYLFPETTGPGQFEILSKYGIATFSQDRSAVYPDFDQKTSEVNFNYILNEFNARLNDLFQEHGLQRCSYGRRPGRGWLADTDVTRLLHKLE